MKNGTWKLKSARPSYRPRPFRRPQRLHCCTTMAGREKKRQKPYPSAVPGPFWPKGFPPLCSLSVVICVFCDFGYGQTRKSRRTASTHGGSLLGKTGLALEGGATFASFSCCRQPSNPRPQTDTQKGPQISTPGLQKEPQN